MEPTNILVTVAPIAVGSIFLITGIFKALAPTAFLRHLKQLHLLPPMLNLTAAIIFTILEINLGLALILRLFPQWLFPSTIGLLLALTALTYWSTSTGRTETCGCYSGLIEVNPQQSLLLNLLYTTLIVYAWLFPVNSALSISQQGIALLIALVMSSLLTITSYLYNRKTGKPVLDLTLPKIGRSWQSVWLPEVSDYLLTGSHLVVFLSTTCPACKKWLGVLNVIHKRSDLPNIIGVVADTPTVVKFYLQSHQIAFPIVAVNSSTMGRLAFTFPTIVVLENGVVQDKWLGMMPVSFIERIKQQESVLVK